MQIPSLKKSKTAVLIAIFFALTTFPSLVQANNDDVVSFSSKWFSVATVKVASFGSSVFDEVWCVAKSILDVGEPCENVPQPLPGKVTVTTKTPNRFVGLVPDAQIPPSPPESPIDKTRELVTQVMQQEGPTYVTNKYITNPTTIIREVIRKFDGGSNGDFVERTLFDAQTTATLDSIQSTASGLQDSITDSVTTAALTVSGNSTLSSLSASGTVTFSLLTGGVLQTDSNGLISTTTIGAAAVTNDSLDFSQLVDNFTLDATATFDLDTNSADMNFDSGTLFIDSSTNRVGIGTTTPGSTLTVAGTTKITGATTLDSTLTVTGNTTLVNASTTNLTVSGTSYFGGQLNLTGSSANIALGSNYLSGDGGDEGVFVSSGGLVGIGTTTPSEALTVVGGISSAGEGTANEVYGLGATLISGPGNGNTLVGAYTEMAAAGFGQYNTIVGAYSSSSNAYNTIIGSRSSATGATSVLIGESLSSSVTYSTVIGANSSVTGTGLLAMGYSAQSSHNNAVAIGWGVASAEDYEYVFGSRAVASTSPSIRLAGSTNQYTGQDLFELDTEWIDSTDATRKSRATLSVYDTAQRTFMQADATGSGVTTSFNGGSVGIGTTTPLSRLAIQTTGTTDILNLFETGGSEVLTVLESGFVGIGASTPAHMVHIKNNSSTYAGLDLEGGQAGDAQWVLFSGYPAAGDFSIRESGVQTSLTIKKTTGNVGIGTTTPAYTLAVQKNGNGSAGTTGILNLAFSAAANTQALQITQNNAGGDGAAASALFKITNAGSNPYFNFDDKFLMTQAGNVGIGTITAEKLLHVYGSDPETYIESSSGSILSLDVDSTSANITSTFRSGGYKPLYLQTGGSTRLAIDTSGNVGIGTTTPNAILMLQGSGIGPQFAINDGGINRARFDNVYSLSLTDASNVQQVYIANSANSSYINSGNVGIGTTAPGTKLSISPGVAYAAPTLGTASGSFSLLGDSGLYGLYAGVSSSGNSWLQAMRSDATATAYDILLNPSGGNVGIGTAAPTEILDVNGLIKIPPANGVDNNSPGITLYSNDDFLYDSDYINNYGLGFHSYNDGVGNGANTYLAGYFGLDFFTTSTSRMRIGTNGNVGIATTTPGRKLTVVGTVEFRSLTAAVGAGSLCLSSSNEVVYNSGSDNCLSSTRDTKHAITPLTLDAINILNELEPVSFIYNGTDRVRYGFIAENTASVDDILATYNAAGDLTGIDDRSILSVLVRAFQEFYREVMDRFISQDSRIDALEERIRELEAREDIEAADPDEEEDVDEATAGSEVIEGEVEDTDTETQEEPEIPETDLVADEASTAEEPEVAEETEVVADVENEEEVEEEPSDETLGL